MKLNFSYLTALCILLLASTGCKYDVDEEPCATTNLKYAEISSIFSDGSCISCHSGANADAGLDLSTYAGVSAYLGSSSSTLIDRITVGTTGDIMPPVGNKLDSCNVSKINAWINAGFPE